VIDAPAGCVKLRSRALHFHPYGIATADSVRIKLNSHRVRIEIVQKDLDFKHVLVRISFDPQVAEAH
jgi:hypothetical protein